MLTKYHVNVSTIYTTWDLLLYVLVILSIGVMSLLQINLPDSVTERYGHSLSTFIMGPHCVWLIVVGGQVKIDKVAVTDDNITMLIELGKYIITQTKHINITNIVYIYLLTTCVVLFICFSYYYMYIM